MDGIGAKLLLTAFFVGLNGFFVAAEFALVRCNAFEIRRLAKEGGRRAALAARILDELSFHLSACQFGITVASLVLGWLAEPAVAALLLRMLAAYDVRLADQDWVRGVALFVALSTITVVHMILGEQAPKIFALQRAESAALNVAYPLRVFVLAFKPLIWAVSIASDRVVAALGASGDVGEHASALGLEQLRTLLAASREAGQIGGRYGKFAEKALEISELQVRQVMVPRVDAVYLSNKRSDEENFALLRDSGHSRFPICETDMDDVVGIVHVKDAAQALLRGERLDLMGLSRRPIFVPELQPVAAFISALQRAGQQCAVVVNEHGTVVGLAFLEDVVEEIIGPVRDEFDVAENDPVITEIEPGLFEAPGSLPMRTVSRWFHIELDDSADTLGGFLMAKLGTLPSEGDEVTVDEHRFRITGMVDRRIATVQIESTAEEPPPSSV